MAPKLVGCPLERAGETTPPPRRPRNKGWLRLIVFKRRPVNAEAVGWMDFPLSIGRRCRNERARKARRPRRSQGPAFKAKVALAALRGDKTTSGFDARPYRIRIAQIAHCLHGHEAGGHRIDNPVPTFRRLFFFEPGRVAWAARRSCRGGPGSIHARARQIMDAE